MLVDCEKLKQKLDEIEFAGSSPAGDAKIRKRMKDV